RAVRLPGSDHVERRFHSPITKPSRSLGRLHGMAASTRWIVLAALVAGVAAVGALNGTASANKSTSSAPARPNVVVLMTDDQTVESMRVMPNVKTLIADQ